MPINVVKSLNKNDLKHHTTKFCREITQLNLSSNPDESSWTRALSVHAELGKDKHGKECILLCDVGEE